MTFASRLTQPDLSLIFYVTISGLPYVWSTRSLPSTWGTTKVTIDGETYNWSKRLILPDEMDVYVEAEPWAGVGSVGSLSFGVRLPGNESKDASSDPMMSILASSIHRGNAAVLIEDLSPTGTTAYVDDTTGWDASGTIYLATETMTYSAKSALTFTGLTRGRWGSMARSSWASYESIEETGSGGAYLADHPLRFAGRLVRLWIGTGEMRDGVFVPYSSTVQGTEDREIYAGYISAWDYSDDLLSIEIETQSLDAVLSREVARHLPKGDVGIHSGHIIFVCPDNWRVPFSWVGAGPDYLYMMSPILTTDGSTEITEGFYHITQLTEYLARTMKAATDSISLGLDEHYHISINQDDDGTWKTWVEATSDSASPPVGNWSAYSLWIHARWYGETNSIWRELGFSQNAYSGPPDESVLNAWWQVMSDRGVPAVRLPAGVANRWVPYSPLLDDFDSAPGWTDDSGNTIDGFALIGEEIVSFSAVSSTTVLGNTVHYLELSGRGMMGTHHDELYIEAKGAETERETITQVLAFPNVSAGRVLTYLLCSGSGTKGSNGTYDQGWRDCGAYVNEDVIDVSAMEKLSTEERHCCVIEATELREVIASEFTLIQAYTLPRYTTRYQLTAKRFTSPNETAATDLTIDHTRISTRHEFRPRVSEDRIVNVIRATNLGYDHGTGDAAENRTHRDGTSTATWGAAEPLDIDMRWVYDLREATDVIESATQQIYALFSRPMLDLEVALAYATDAWLTEIGDLVEISHDILPKMLSVGWGQTSLRGIVYSVCPQYRSLSEDTARGILRILCAGYSGQRFGYFAPSVRVNAIDGSATVLTCDDHYWSHEDDDKDVEYYAASYRVRLYNPGNEGSAETRTILGVTLSGTPDASQIRLTAATALSVPIIVEFAGYSDASYQAAQYTFVHMSDDDRKLDKASGSDRAFYFGAAG